MATEPSLTTRTIPIVPVSSGPVSGKIQMRATSGVFTRWRWAMVWLTQALYYGLPWLQMRGHQAVLFDLQADRFFLFGAVLYPQDLIYLAALLVVSALLLFFATAVAEIVGCFLPYLWLRKDGSIWLLLPAALSLVLFVWLLSLHPAASGRVYAAYGGVYVVSALLWLRFVDGVKLSPLDWLGAGVTLVGMAIIVSAWKAA